MSDYTSESLSVTYPFQTSAHKLLLLELFVPECPAVNLLQVGEQISLTSHAAFIIFAFLRDTFRLTLSNILRPLKEKAFLQRAWMDSRSSLFCSIFFFSTRVVCALLILLMHSANSPSGPLNIHFSCLPIRCASQSCYRSPLKVFRSVYNCQISPWQTQLSFWSCIPSLENSVLFASCREISLLLFSGNNFDNCPWAPRQIAFQSKHEEGEI